MPEEKRVNVPKVVSTRRPQLSPSWDSTSSPATVLPCKMSTRLVMSRKNTVLEMAPDAAFSLLCWPSTRDGSIAVELDRVLAAQLRLRFAMFPNVEVIRQIFLSIDFDSLFGPKAGLEPSRHRIQARSGQL